jgi:hypothetical protein
VFLSVVHQTDTIPVKTDIRLSRPFKYPNTKKEKNLSVSHNRSSTTRNPFLETKMIKWTIWSAIEKLEASQGTFYPNLTPKVVPILRLWANKWDGEPEWRSVLNKKSLHKELEESIVAIDLLLRREGIVLLSAFLLESKLGA